MSNDLELHPDLAPAPTALFAGGLTRDQVELLKTTICKDASDDELQLFVAVCNSRRLNPFTGQIHFVKRRQWNSHLNNGDGGYEYVGSHQTGIDGYRLIAERTGRYEGRVGTWWCGPDGHWRDVWLEETPPSAAKVAVQRRGFAKPTEAIARWKAYVQTKRDGKPNTMWARMDAEQLAKCAEALALRTAFPEELSGIYTTDEMAQATNPPTVVVDGATGELLTEVEHDPGRDGILADGWNSRDEQNEAHRRLNLYLAQHRLGAWEERWRKANGYTRPYSTGQLEELRRAVVSEQSETARGGAGRGAAAAGPQMSGAGSSLDPDVAGDAASGSSGSPVPDPTPTSPSAPEQEEAPESREVARSRAEGANHDPSKPGAGPSLPDATMPPDGSQSPGRPSGGTKRSRPAVSNPGREPTGRAPTDPEDAEQADLAAFEQAQADERNPGRWTP